MIQKDEKFAKALQKELTAFPNTIRNSLPDTTFQYPIKYNSDKFRSPQFKNNVDILFAGCSFTFGTGLPEEFVWGPMLAQENNLSYNSIGIEGGSCMHIIFNIFKYFEKYGHPKVLIALLPDFYRTYTYLDGKILNTTRMFGSSKIADDNIFTNDSGPHGPTTVLKYLSLPTTANNIYSKEFSYMLSSVYIKMLEVYCNSHSIPFLWMKWWNDPIDKLVELNNFPNIEPKDYNVELKKYSVDRSPSIDEDFCHKEYQEKVVNDPDLWNSAKDKVHNGLHWHIHVKEIFENVLREKGLL